MKSLNLLKKHLQLFFICCLFQFGYNIIYSQTINGDKFKFSIVQMKEEINNTYSTTNDQVQYLESEQWLLTNSSNNRTVAIWNSSQNGNLNIDLNNDFCIDFIIKYFYAKLL